MAPLLVVERGATSVKPGNSNGGCNVVSTSVVVLVGHECRRDVVEPFEWTEYWLGLVVGAKNLKWTRRRPKHHNTRSADEGASWLAGQTSDLARCTISSTEVLWRQGDAGFVVPGTIRWSGNITRAEGHGQRYPGRRLGGWRTGKAIQAGMHAMPPMWKSAHGNLPRQRFPPTL
jgi:hypothetical protein